MRLLPARRETVREPDVALNDRDQPDRAESRPEIGRREFVRRVGDAATAAHQEHVPF